jgi:signal transduction histidine kinase
MSLAVFFLWLLVKEISRRRHVLQLLDQKLRLESLGELTGRVAHDFNNLLFVISGNLEMLEMLHTCPPHRIEAIRGAAERGLKITNDLLNFSRGGTTKPIIVELNEHVQGVIETSCERFPTNVSIVFDIDRVNSLFVEVDAVQLDLAILNILINSCDAMPNGGRVEVITRKDRDWISLIIRDTGPGIPLDILPRIFDPFFTTKGRKGNGFGLSQVYGFVKQVNGTISIESKDGTTITMNFRSVGRYSDVA